jgi:GT2 family glycosyltransferase
MDVRKKISVIILAHNKAKMTLRCLEALAPALAGLDHEVILRDNGSTENIDSLRDCAGIFQSYGFIRGEENLSFSVANNLLAREAAGDFLLFINNDVFCRPDTVRNLLRPLIENSAIGVTGGKLLYPGEQFVQNAGMMHPLWGTPTSYAAGAIADDTRIQNACERFALWGAMLCVPREVFDQVAGFDERYLWGFEDVDLCLKIRVAGKKVFYCPDAVAVHLESATLKAIRSTETDERNYRIYRQTWDSILVPVERQYISGLKDQGIRRVAVFGMGTAARGLSKILDENGIEIAAFTASNLDQPGVFLDRPALPLTMLNQAQYDRVMVASQYFFEIEPTAREYDPQRTPIWPLL